MVPKSIRDYLEAAGVSFRARELPAGLSDRDAAVLLGSSPHRMARSVLVVAGTERVLLVVPDGAKVDPEAVERVCGLSPVRPAAPEELRAAFPDCDPAFAPPLGELYALPVLVDVTLAQPGPIYLRGGTPTDVLELDFVDFADLEDPLVASLTDEGEALAGPTFAQGALNEVI